MPSTHDDHKHVAYFMSKRTETCLLSPMETLIITDSEPVNFLSNPVPEYLRHLHLVDDK